MRASHDTRDHTVARLRHGYLTGRLGTDTFTRRVDEALRATSSDELRGSCSGARAGASSY